jgi:hypothetical protein
MDVVVRVAQAAHERVAAVDRGDLDVTTLADAFGASLASGQIAALFTRHPDRLHTSATPSLFFL